MFDVHLYTRRNGRCPAREYIAELIGSGRQRDAGRIDGLISQPGMVGSQELISARRAEKMNDLWQLR